MQKEYQNPDKCLHLFSPHEPINQKYLKLLQIISNLTHEVEYCYAFNEYLASQVGVSIRTIKRYIRRVEKMGYINCFYSRKRAYWRHIYITELTEYLFEDVTNTTSNIKINNTKPIPSQEPIQNLSVSSFSDDEIEKELFEISKMEKNVEAGRKSVTKMWENGISMFEIREHEERLGNLERLICQSKHNLEKLRRKKFDHMCMRLLNNMGAHVKRLMLLCKHKRLNFKSLYLSIMQSIQSGPLSICKKTGKKMHEAMGFNIAMKLIREKRWQVISC